MVSKSSVSVVQTKRDPSSDYPSHSSSKPSVQDLAVELAKKKVSIIRGLMSKMTTSV